MLCCTGNRLGFLKAKNNVKSCFWHEMSMEKKESSCPPFMAQSGYERYVQRSFNLLVSVNRDT